VVIDFWPALAGTICAILLWKSIPAIFNILVSVGMLTYLHWPKIRRAGDILLWVVFGLAALGIVIKESSK
jgi:hypothetical protein